MLDQVCGPVTIVADHNSAGHSICADPWHTYGVWDRRGKYRDVRTVIRGRLIAFMAGAEAETEILGRSAGGDGDDRYQIDLMLEEAGFDFDYLPSKEQRLRRATRQLVRRHRKIIEKVALALLDHGTLEDAQIEALMGGK